MMMHELFLPPCLRPRSIWVRYSVTCYDYQYWYCVIRYQCEPYFTIALLHILRYGSRIVLATVLVNCEAVKETNSGRFDKIW